jgi:hypothetical protein
VADGADVAVVEAAAKLVVAAPAGSLIEEVRYGAQPGTDNRWMPVAAFTAAEGEVIDGRAYFRVEVVGEAGNDGNVFELGVSLSPERDDPPAGLRMFSYLPTVRWPSGGAPTELRFMAPAGSTLTLQNFDAANADMQVVSTYGALPLTGSGQDIWADAAFVVPEGATAISIRGGSESPNDVTLGLFDAAGNPVALEMPARPSVPQPRPVADYVARPLADCTSVAFDATASRGSGPLVFHWDFGDGAGTDEAAYVHRYNAPGTYEAVLRIAESDGRVANGALARVPVLVRPAPVAVAGDTLTRYTVAVARR